MSKQSAINQPLAIILHLDGRIRALGVEYDELGTIDVYVLEGEALRRHLMREAISMQSACNHLLAAGERRVRQMLQHALSMHSACTQHALSICTQHVISMQSACNHLLAAGEPRVRQMVQHAISMHSACTQHALSMHSACTHLSGFCKMSTTSMISCLASVKPATSLKRVVT